MPWKCLAIPPLVYVACGLPAMLADKPLFEVLLHWGRQSNAPQLTLGATNWYQWISNEHYGVFFMAGIALTLVATAFLVLAMQEETCMVRGDWFVTTALLSVLIVPYFLPGMHERYFYPADVFSLMYAFFVRRGWIVAVLVQFCSFFTYLPYLFKAEPIPRVLLALVMTAALVLAAAAFVRELLGTRDGNIGKEEHAA